METNPHHDVDLWHRLAEAAAFAVTIHARQTRKGTDIPYIAHLLGVASLVLEHGGDEEQAMAGLLHDAIEDAGAHQERAIAARFGPRVAAIVRGCTDADTVPKPPWRARKEAYIAHLDVVGPDVLLVSAADKLHNARAICTDLRTHGHAVYDRFKGGRDGTLWYYRALSETYSRLLPSALSVELAEAVEEMEWLTRNGFAPEGHALIYASASDEALSQRRSAGSIHGDAARSSAPLDGQQQRDAFNARLAGLCQKLTSKRIESLIAEVRAVALNREPWLDGANFWDEFALVIAEDRTTFREIYDEKMREICRLVIDQLPELEREILSRCNDAYREMWDPGEPEPNEADRVKWAADQLFRELFTEANDHGWRLRDGDGDTGDEALGDEVDENEA